MARAAAGAVIRPRSWSLRSQNPGVDRGVESVGDDVPGEDERGREQRDAGGDPEHGDFQYYPRTDDRDPFWTWFIPEIQPGETLEI